MLWLWLVKTTPDDGSLLQQKHFRRQQQRLDHRHWPPQTAATVSGGRSTNTGGRLQLVRMQSLPESPSGRSSSVSLPGEDSGEEVQVAFTASFACQADNVGDHAAVRVREAGSEGESESNCRRQGRERRWKTAGQEFRLFEELRSKIWAWEGSWPWAFWSYLLGQRKKGIAQRKIRSCQDNLQS